MRDMAYVPGVALLAALVVGCSSRLRQQRERRRQQGGQPHGYPRTSGQVPDPARPLPCRAAGHTEGPAARCGGTARGPAGEGVPGVGVRHLRHRPQGRLQLEVRRAERDPEPLHRLRAGRLVRPRGERRRPRRHGVREGEGHAACRRRRLPGRTRRRTPGPRARRRRARAPTRRSQRARRGAPRTRRTPRPPPRPPEAAPAKAVPETAVSARRTPSPRASSTTSEMPHFCTICPLGQVPPHSSAR